MEIVKDRAGRVVLLRLTGRLDHHWSQPVDDALEEVIRDGARHVRLDLSGVSYLSTAGAAVLQKCHQQTSALLGTFEIAAASERVRETLRQLALDDLFVSSTEARSARSRTLSVPLAVGSERATYESRLVGTEKAQSFLTGDPSRLSQAPYDDAHSASLAAGKDVFAVGVGALGASYDECRGLFGEFVAAAGTAAFMPTDGTATPDYMLSSGKLVPEVRSLYAIGFRGAPTHQLRFEACAPSVNVPLSEIVQACVSLAGTTEVGIVMSAEVAGLVCARLRRSPAQNDAAQFDFPSVRQWLSFTPEHEYARFSSLIVGVASTDPSAEMRPFVRPMSDALHGHFHAAVTAFRSLPRGRLELEEVVADSFQPQSVFSVVHLLRDARANEGAGESMFQRGTCWVFPIRGAEDEL